jgi:low affinity Fe/Cu permease
MYRSSRFSRFAKWIARMSGHPSAFGLAALVIAAWLATGPVFGYSDTWQLVINTGTTIVTFLMVFLIQNTQNRDGEAMQLKLDEIIRSLEGAHNVLLDMEELEEKELEHIRQRYIELARLAREKRRRGEPDVDTPEVAPDE